MKTGFGGPATFTARYGGPCAADCGQDIEVGDDACYNEDDLVVHAECYGRVTVDDGYRRGSGYAPEDLETSRLGYIPEDHSTPPKEPELCMSCFLQHAGECM
ncbi:hypothetical protein SEA_PHRAPPUCCINO_126 [Mycobacterium phage Phrappuccino]|uniref:Uncharacterized protein n=1 Tax=Mycobacterium phage Phrappuccino TaxID=2591223 RepID=A0A514DDV9_9CAUD|nr:hypothetical protein KHQ87_gp126 [Mycobacterium phage Phrappuccino]QDH91801.1 hypothetical protein SEA_PHRAPPUCCINO_126 [Mycobacterium phage Phrappuccino]QIQ63243.1 hypothetical protein SEA_SETTECANDELA_126 [Mycobacterium phage Settecandela]